MGVVGVMAATPRRFCQPGQTFSAHLAATTPPTPRPPASTTRAFAYAWQRRVFYRTVTGIPAVFIQPPNNAGQAWTRDRLPVCLTFSIRPVDATIACLSVTTTGRIGVCGECRLAPPWACLWLAVVTADRATWHEAWSSCGASLLYATILLLPATLQRSSIPTCLNGP